MTISDQDARNALADIQHTTIRTRRMLAYSGMDAILILWGIIWLVGYVNSQFLPHVAIPNLGIYHLYPQAVWGILISTGLLFTFIIAKRSQATSSERENKVGRRIGIFWGLLYGYAYVAAILFWPLIEPNSNAEATQLWIRMNAIAGIIPMFAYVVMGLWLDNALVVVGLVITVLAVLGVYIAPAYICLWMGVVGGGALIGSGVLIRRTWK